MTRGVKAWGALFPQEGKEAGKHGFREKGEGLRKKWYGHQKWMPELLTLHHMIDFGLHLLLPFLLLEMACGRGFLPRQAHSQVHQSQVHQSQHW